MRRAEANLRTGDEDVEEGGPEDAGNDLHSPHNVHRLKAPACLHPIPSSSYLQAFSTVNNIRNNSWPEDAHVDGEEDDGFEGWQFSGEAVTAYVQLV